jgi:iron(III) transport system permease protein
MTSVAERASAPTRIKPKLGRDDFLLRAAIAVIGLYLVITLALPLWAMLSKSFETYHFRFAQVEVEGRTARPGSRSAPSRNSSIA